jgi:hypothetical protein
MQDEIRKAQQTFAEETRETVTEFRLKRQQTLDKYKQQYKEKCHHGSKHPHHSFRHAHGLSPGGSQDSLPTLHHAHTFPGVPHKDASQLDYEEAIQQSVAMTSKGNPEEDALIERAIRASVAELQSAQAADFEHDDALQKAIQAGIAEVRKVDADGAANEEPNALSYHNDDAVLEESLYRSLHDFHFPGDHSQNSHEAAAVPEISDTAGGIDSKVEAPPTWEKDSDKLPKQTEQKQDLVQSG